MAVGTPGVRRGATRVVLVVDDDPVSLESLKDILQASLPGVEAVTAASGADALRLLAVRRVDLIITDYRMPGMDGVAFLRAARAQAPDTPRVIITAFPELDAALRAINEAGVEAFLTKPFAPGTVIDVVRSILLDAARRRGQQPPQPGAPQRAPQTPDASPAAPTRTPAFGSKAGAARSARPDPRG